MGMVVILLSLFVSGCRTNIKNDVEEYPDYPNAIDDTININLRNQVDSLMELELKHFNTNQELNDEIEKLKVAYDSIMQSNKNLNNYIKHQDKMIKK